jgi:peroxiredoxin
LQSLYEKFSTRGFTILAVNAWDEPKEKIEKFAQSNKLTYPILLGGRSVLRDKYRGKEIPHNFLVDKSGNIAWSLPGWGPSLVPELEERIETLLKE